MGENTYLGAISKFAAPMLDSKHGKHLIELPGCLDLFDLTIES
jgi:hypothetical protein